MEVRLAETAGFCYGVERAVNTVYEEIEKGTRPIFTYGPIVHNDLVVNELGAKGVRVIKDPDMLRNMSVSGELRGSAVIIRAHGVGRDVTEI